MKLVILAAGNGSRFKPLTNLIPKTLIPVDGEHILFRIMDIFYESVDSFILVVNKKTGPMIMQVAGAYYKDKKIAYVVQDNEEKSGTMHSLSSVKDYLNQEESFLVCNSDDLFNKDEINKVLSSIDTSKPTIFTSLTIMPKGYISIVFDKENNYLDIVSNKEIFDKPNHYVSGLYILNKGVFDLEPVRIYNGEFGLPQTLFKNSNKYKLKVYGLRKWQSINSPEEIIVADTMLKNGLL